LKGQHAAFYAGSETLFHAHGSTGTPTGYSKSVPGYNELKSYWIGGHGYPDVYRQKMK